MAPLEKKRLAAGLTQEQMAEKVGVSAGTISLWEAGKRIPQPGYYAPLARVFGITPAEVVDLVIQTKQEADAERAAASA